VVFAAIGDYVPDATCWIGNITLVAWNNVDMKVEDGLACEFSNIHPDVVAPGPIETVDCLSRHFDTLKNGYVLFPRNFEPGRHVATRYYEGMSLINGELVPEA
jgi:hypothetical protein